MEEDIEEDLEEEREEEETEEPEEEEPEEEEPEEEEPEEEEITIKGIGSLSDDKDGGGKSNGLKSGGAIIVLLALAIHVLDGIWLGYGRSGSSLFTALAVYVLLALGISIVVGGINGKLLEFYKVWKYPDLRLLWIIVLSYIFIPMIVFKFSDLLISYGVLSSSFGFFGLSMAKSFYLIFLFTPALPIALCHMTDIRWLKKVSDFYIGAWVILFLLMFLINVSVPTIQGSMGVDYEEPLNRFGNYLWGTFTGKNVRDKFGQVYRAYNQTKRGLLGEEFYRGRVENNNNEPLGVYIDHLRLANSQVYEGDPITLWAYVEGKTFMEELVTVYPSCRIAGSSGMNAEPAKSIDPKEFDIGYQEQRIVNCEFEGKEPGYYTLTFSSAFNFETWSYITYTFMKRDTFRKYAQEGENVAQKIGVDQKPTAVYTSGPVALGLASIKQPALVSSDDSYLNQAFGVTLSNNWPQGEIYNVERIELLVPNPIKLENCDKSKPMVTEDKRVIDGVEKPTGYRKYIFSKDVQARNRFKSVTCRLTIDSEKDISQILGGESYSQKTFVARAVYQYSLEETKKVSVKK